MIHSLQFSQLLQVTCRSDDTSQVTSSNYTVEDPVCDEFYHDTWIYNAKRNMQIYEEVCQQLAAIHALPSLLIIHDNYYKLEPSIHCC